MSEGDRPRYCEQCGSLTQAGDRFCGVCGAGITPNAPDATTREIPTQVQPPQGVTEDQVTPTRNNKAFLVTGVVGMVLLLLVGGGALAFVGLGGSPENGGSGGGDSGEVTSAQERVFSNEVEFSPKNIEAGAETAGLSILKESLEYLIEEGPEDIKAMDGNESAFLQGAIDAQLITSNPDLHKAKPEDVNFEDFTIEGVDLSKPKVDIVYDKGNEGEFIEEDYLSVGIEPPEGGSKTIAASFLVDREKFEFFSNEEEIKKAIKDLENGKLEGLKPSYMIYQDLTSGRSGEAAEDMDDYEDIQKSKDKAELYLDSPQDPEKIAKKLNKIWKELPEVLEISPRKLNLVSEVPENASEDQHQEADTETGSDIVETAPEPDDGSPEQSPTQVLALQYQYINAGDYEAAYELFAEESREIVSLDQYRAFFEEMGYYQLTDYSFPSVDVQGDSAVVEVNFTSETPTGEGQYQPVQQMVFEDGEWRIVMRDDQLEAFTETG